MSEPMGNTSPAITVIVLNYNGIAHLDECLSSLEKQTCRDFETILVDNGSTDGSLDIVEKRFPNVQILALKENSGFCKGNNMGISISRGRFIAFLNNDTRADTDWLQELYKSISNNDKIGFCSSKVVIYDNPDLIDTAGDGLSICGAPFKRGHLECVDRFEHGKYVFGASGSASLYRKSMLEKTGGLDEDFFAIFEDCDLSLRCQLMGYRCLYVPTAIVLHKVNSTLRPLSNFYVYYGHRNVEYFYIKNMPTALIIRYFHLHILYNALAWLYFCYKGKGFIFLKAKLDVLKNLPVLLRKRSEIQKSRKVSTRYIKQIMDKRWLSARMKKK